MSTFASALAPADRSPGRSQRESRAIFPAKSGRLPFVEQCLAVATKKAVKDAGGLKVCEHATKVSDSQLSRCSNRNLRDSISIRDAVRIDAIGAAKVGHPRILTAMARFVGAVVVMLPKHEGGASGLQMSVLDLTSELGDVSRSISEALASSSSGGTDITPDEAEATLDQLADLERATAKLRRQLEEIARGAGDVSPTTKPP